MSQPSPNPAALDGGLYFQIVCDPGHERTTRELRALPRESRERVWADMTGDPNTTQVQPRPEDPEMVKERLDQFNQELGKISDNEFLKLALRSTKMAHDPKFRLRFLRAVDFDAYRAAHRMARHFDQKWHLFGEENLGKVIRLHDMNADDIESLSSGAIQFLPKTDRNGRLVFVIRNRNFVYKDKENMDRAVWYMFMSLLDIPNFDQIGYVVVGYEVGEWVPVDYELTRRLFKLAMDLPMRPAAIHSCYSESKMSIVVDLVVHLMSSFARHRLRVHHGSHQECRYRLLTMGIPVDYLPVTMDGVLHTENHRQWLQHRVQREQARGHLLAPKLLQKRTINTVESDEYDDDAIEY